MTNSPNIPNPAPDDDAVGPPPRDELDGLLRQWHQVHADKAAAGRDRLMASLSREDTSRHEAIAASASDPENPVLARIEPETDGSARPSVAVTIRRILVNRYSPLAAAAILLAVILPFVLPKNAGFVAPASAQPSNIVMAPDGGRLDAFDKAGDLLGPCELKHTDVKAEISGRFSRVTVTQQYHNPHPDKIEAVYTFPLSDRAGVDRMTMTIGDRVIVGEVKERQAARRIYEQARDSGRIASLLEQERPNIFTQSVANIEPGATINIEISYVEIVAEHDGEFTFDFPTVVGPRYIPGAAYRRERVEPLPAGSQTRRGLVLPAPATVAKASIHEKTPGERPAPTLARMLADASPIAAPTQDVNTLPAVWYDMNVSYPDGSGERAIMLTDGRGEVGGRWFFCPVGPPPPAGEAFAQPTNKVPDADRITPMPVRPGTRAGHDLSISVTLDTGGPGISALESPLHETVRTDLDRNGRGEPKRVSLALKDQATIPNRDFVLKWRQTGEAIGYRAFTHTEDHGNFFAIQLDAPPQVKDDRAVPRELVFVVDNSGSMNGQPIALCRQVMHKAIDAMRPQDTFNIISFSGSDVILWDHPRPNSQPNRDEALKFIDSWQGSGGTEMMKAIESALRQPGASERIAAITPAQLADLPADGRQVMVEVDDGELSSDEMKKGGTLVEPQLVVRDGLSIKCSSIDMPEAYRKRAAQIVQQDDIVLHLLLRGTWMTKSGERFFQVASAEMLSDSSVRPLRIVTFMTDGFVGNDFEIIDAIRRNRGTSRVFPFGVGNSVNRWLIEQMAIAGGGEPEFVYIDQNTEAEASTAVERFNRRTRTPVLTDVSIAFNGVQPLDVLPDPASVHDLWDNRPLTFLGRYAAPGQGSVTIKAQTAQGRWEKTIPLVFPDKQPENSSLPTLWARARIDSLMSQDMLGIQRGQPNPEVRAQIIQVGESFNVMSQYTSFVAVDKLRVTINGKPRLVHVPIELPDATNWKGFFGELPPADAAPDKGDLRRPGADGGSSKVRVLTLNDEVVRKIVQSSDARGEAGLQSEKEKAVQIDREALLVNSYGVSPAAPTPPPPPAIDPSVASVLAPPSSGAHMAGVSSTPPNKQEPVGVVQNSPGLTTTLREGSFAPGGSDGKRMDVQLREELGRFSKDGRLRVDDLSTNHSFDSNADGVDRSSLPSDFFNFGSSRGDHAGKMVQGYSQGIELMGDIPALGLAFSPSHDLMDFPEDWPNKSFVRANAAVQQTATCVLTLAAAQLAQSGRIDEARKLACSGANQAESVAGDGKNSTHVQQGTAEPTVERLCGALNDAKLPDAERQVVIEGCREQASADLLERRRVATIARRLSPDLFIQTKSGEKFRATSPQSTLEASKIAPDASITVIQKDRAANKELEGPKPIAVVILLADTFEKTLEALKALGLEIITIRPEAGVVIARVMPDKLEALALLETVKRVESVPDDEPRTK